MTYAPKNVPPILLSFEASMRGTVLPLLHKGKIADTVPELPKRIFGEGKARYAEPVRKVFGEGSPKVFVPDAMNFVIHLEGPKAGPGTNRVFAKMYSDIAKSHFTSNGFEVLETTTNQTEKGMDLEIKVALDAEGLKRAAEDPNHFNALKNKRLIAAGNTLAANLLPERYTV